MFCLASNIYYVDLTIRNVQFVDSTTLRVHVYLISGDFLFQVYHVAEGREKNPRFFDEDLEDHQPFPMLQTVLQELEQHVGCNIEIKWTMQLKVRIFLYY